jgi:integrase
VWFELTDQTRLAIEKYLRLTGRKSGQVLFAGRSDGSRGLATRQYARSLWIPIHPALAEALAARVRRDGLLLANQSGAPFSANGFGNYMADRIDEAGLPARCVTHGLRKASARPLAEAGRSANEIAAITGHATLQKVTRYTKAAEQRKLAAAAMRRLTRNTAAAAGPTKHTESQTYTGGLGFRSKNPRTSMDGETEWRPVGESNPCFQRERLTS